MWKIKLKHLVISTVILFFAFFRGINVYADDGSLGRTPEGVFPMKENDVVMESEEITVDLENFNVECIFVFHNTGESKNVLMGFPGKLDKSLGGELTEEVNLELQDFKTFVKEKELSVSHEKSVRPQGMGAEAALNYSEWFTFTVPFKADEKVTVRNTYHFRPSFISTGDVLSGYVLKTGALWKGPIGSAKVTFKLGGIQPYQIETLKSGGFKFTGNELVWERNNFEPLYDLQVFYNDWHYSDEFLKNTSGEEASGLKEKMQNYKRVKELADSKETDKLLDLYDKAVQGTDYVLVQYIRSFLPENRIPAELPIVGDILVSKEQWGYRISSGIQSLSAPFAKLVIRHIENGKEVMDREFDMPYGYIDLVPGVEYSIACFIQDWMDRTAEKTVKYKVPEEVNTPLPVATQPLITETTSEPTVLTSETESSQTPGKETGENFPGLFVKGASDVLVIGFSTILLALIVIIIIRSKRQ